MNTDYSIIKEDLSSLGLTRGDSVLIHSSFKSLGKVDGGIQTLIDGILSVIGDSGTLIAPTLTYRDVSVSNPVFDYVNTPSCVGAVSEFVRLHPDAIRSIHPTHSCAVIGGKREWYISGHENDRTPIGENSPFYKLSVDGGKILMLGCGTGPNTSAHGIEEKACVSYVLPKEPSPYTVILPEKTYQIQYYRHHIMQNGYAQHYSRLVDIMDGQGISHGSVHGAEAYLIDAHYMWEVGLAALKKDEFAFVDKIK